MTFLFHRRLLQTVINATIVVEDSSNSTHTTKEEVVEVVPVCELESEDELETDLSLAIFSLLMTVFVAIVIGRFTQGRKWIWLQPSATSLLLGILIGGLVKIVTKDNSFIKSYISFTPSFFFLFLVPPVIFNAGFTLDSATFFRYSAAFCTYAFIGTIISMFIIYGTLMLFKVILNYGMSPLHSLIFGSLISATDPVTVLAIFSQLNVDRHLYTLVFGESVMNDAVAIVLYGTLLRFEPKACEEAEKITAGAVFAAIGFFFLVFIGSVAIGAVTGFLSALILKKGWFRSDEFKIMEASLVVILPYVAYMSAEALQLSGIVAILFCGIIMSHYTKRNLTPDTAHIIDTFFEIVAYVSEMFIFIYIGTTVFLESHRWKLMGYVTLVLGVVLISRAINIYPLTFLINRWRKRNEKVSFAQQHMLFFSGLRGGIAFALALQARKDIIDEKDGTLILDCTLLIVIFTVLVNGGLTPRMLKVLRIKHGADYDGDDVDGLHVQYDRMNLMVNEDNATMRGADTEPRRTKSDEKMTLTRQISATWQKLRRSSSSDFARFLNDSEKFFISTNALEMTNVSNSGHLHHHASDAEEDDSDAIAEHQIRPSVAMHAPPSTELERWRESVSSQPITVRGGLSSPNASLRLTSPANRDSLLPQTSSPQDSLLSDEGRL